MARSQHLSSRGAAPQRCVCGLVGTCTIASSSVELLFGVQSEVGKCRLRPPLPYAAAVRAESTGSLPMCSDCAKKCSVVVRRQDAARHETAPSPDTIVRLLRSSHSFARHTRKCRGDGSTFAASGSWAQGRHLLWSR